MSWLDITTDRASHEARAANRMEGAKDRIATRDGWIGCVRGARVIERRSTCATMEAHVDVEIVEPETGQVWGPKSFATPQTGSILTIAHLAETEHVKKHSAR
jgi:hypothetical protein